MTSKNLCFKLMKEDLKRRIWTVALLMLAFFFGIVVPVIYAGGQPLDSFVNYADWLKNVRESVWEFVGGENPFVIMTVVVAAVVCGVSGFSYLHNAKKVDFYHSIPVKREQLFWASYLNGIVMMGAVYLLNLLIAIVAASTFGVGFGDTFVVAMTGFAFHMAFYSLMYTTVVLAMMLTGNVIIALLGSTVFFYYIPGVVLLAGGYMSTWLQTFSYTDSLNKTMEYLMVHTSPFIYYIMKIDSYGEESVAAAVLAVCLVTILMAVIVCLLYRCRPSESAGKAIAFKKTMAPIKILLVLPFALAFCLFFYMLRDSFGWAVFGVVCGTLIVHCLMEIIYHFDFRKLFSHKVHLVICMVAGLLILCGFKFDLFGYDTYLPKESQVKSASIYLRSMDNWVSYGNVEYERGYYRWNYEDGDTYVREHMKLEHAADVIALAEQGIRYNEMQESGQWSDEYNNTEFVGFTVEYTLKSGRRVSRIYTADLSEIEGTLERIYDSEQYKEGVYPILAQTGEETLRVNFQQFNNIIGTVKDGASAEILAAYQEELKGLTYETRKKEAPIGTIQFVTTEMDKALQARENDSSNGYYYSRDIADRSYYPVYPGFTKTLELLKTNGVLVMNVLSSANISQVEIRDYSYGEDTEYGYRYYNDDERYFYITEKAEIEELAPALIFEDYYYMNEMAWWKQVVNYNEVTATMNDGTMIRCYLDTDKVPDFLTKRMEEAKAESAKTVQDNDGTVVAEQAVTG